MGFFASFPLDPEERKVDLLRGVLALEDPLGFRKMDVGKVMGSHSTKPFSESGLKRALKSLEEGSADFLYLLPFWRNREWVRSFENSVSIYWTSFIPPRGHRDLSPYEKRFGDAGTLLVEYPLSRFTANAESPFQTQLVRFAKQHFVDQGLHWAFIHLGSKPLDYTGLGLDPHDLGKDGPFLRTRGSFPLTAFDTDLKVAAGYFKEHVKGAFWTNFLNPFHVSILGGWQVLLPQLSCEVAEQLSHFGAFLRVTRSPLDPPTSRAIEAYQRLRRLLRPILLETPEEVFGVQRAIMGDWTPESVRPT